MQPANHELRSPLDYRRHSGDLTLWRPHILETSADITDRLEKCTCRAHITPFHRNASQDLTSENLGL